MRYEILRLSHLNKSFKNTPTLKDLSLNIFRGEILTILSLNKAGKTLYNYLSGGENIDSGIVYFEHKKISYAKTLNFIKLGICFISHYPNLVPKLSVAENLYLPFINKQNKTSIINKKYMQKFVQNCLDTIDIDINVNTLVKNLTLIEQRLLELARAYLLENKLIVIDDDSFSSYSHNDIDIINKVVRTLKGKNYSFLFFTHDVKKSIGISDRILILKEGEIIKTFNRDDYDYKCIFKILVGADSFKKPKYIHKPDNCLKCSIDIIDPSKKNSISVSAYKGEVLGILDSNSKISDMLTEGLLDNASTVKFKGFLNGKPFKFKNLKQAKKLGFGFILEHSADTTLFNNRNAEENLSVLVLDKLKYKFFPFINNKLFNVFKDDYELYDLCENKDPIGTSAQLGFFQRQKILLCKWLISQPEVLIFIKPFSQLDPISKHLTDIYFDRITANGTTIIIISNDFSVTSSICDRFLFADADSTNFLFDKVQ